MRIHQDAAELQNNIEALQDEVFVLQQQSTMLDKLLLRLMQDAKPSTKPDQALTADRISPAKL